MKTYKQFSEDMKKNFQNFLNNPDTQDLIGRIKKTQIGNVGSLKDPLKKFTKGKAVEDLKTAGLDTLQKGANNMLNKIFDTARKKLD